ncbi:Holin of 3TMs, for gene-transfer release [Yoonia tamlensis]|uniref:Holin of 3TMs, for gene-transfer release n=1 Tax=Yoonia tamlensis TaxID=390270 RepID=A0A1I6G5I2_9RHOB|nr:holin family protein [Yoonia tamlensis]SFR37459.1 Holin of 3TMs, for gene-transfer release [Yoonia tamlensis]
MGLITGVMGFLFGDGRNVITDTAEVFRENAEGGAARAANAKSESLQQFAAEFAHARRGLFDRFVDGLNRLPRPMLALGTIWMFIAAMRWPDEFIRGMEGLALVPEPLWWLMGAIVSFYFGARHQAKEQDFQRAVASTIAAVQASKAPESVPVFSDNPALDDWQARNG